MPNVRGATHLLKTQLGAWSLCLLTGAALVFSLLWHPAPPPRYQGLTQVRKQVPSRMAGFTLVGDNRFSEPIKQALASADLLSRSYRNDTTGQVVDFTLIGGTDRSALHDPRSCLIGAGWRIEDDHVETIAGTAVPIRVCRVVSGERSARDGSDVTEKGTGYEAMYLYVVSGQPIDQVTQIRSQMLASALIGRKNTPVCFVRFMRPLLTDPQADAASHQQFAAFVSRMWETVRIPQSQQTADASGARAAAPQVAVQQ
ncbi:MAG: exosortase-associated EpsI family protein [Cytophagales bacterium]|nr:exosortase-associated EpsI family protein [Armatimonadota bacterium]